MGRNNHRKEAGAVSYLSEQPRRRCWDWPMPRTHALTLASSAGLLRDRVLAYWTTGTRAILKNWEGVPL